MIVVVAIAEVATLTEAATMMAATTMKQAPMNTPLAPTAITPITHRTPAAKANP